MDLKVTAPPPLAAGDQEFTVVSARLAYAGYDGEDLAAGVRQLILDVTVKNSSDEPFTLVSRSLSFTFDGKKLKANLVDGASDVDPGSISERQVVTVDIPGYHAGEIDLTVYGIDSTGTEVERSVALNLPPD
jgi:hypothetical protein